MEIQAVGFPRHDFRVVNKVHVIMAAVAWGLGEALGLRLQEDSPDAFAKLAVEQWRVRAVRDPRPS